MEMCWKGVKNWYYSSVPLWLGGPGQESGLCTFPGHLDKCQLTRSMGGSVAGQCSQRLVGYTCTTMLPVPTALLPTGGGVQWASTSQGLTLTDSTNCRRKHLREKFSVCPRCVQTLTLCQCPKQDTTDTFMGIREPRSHVTYA